MAATNHTHTVTGSTLSGRVATGSKSIWPPPPPTQTTPRAYAYGGTLARTPIRDVLLFFAQRAREARVRTVRRSEFWTPERRATNVTARTQVRVIGERDHRHLCANSHLSHDEFERMRLDVTLGLNANAQHDLLENTQSERKRVLAQLVCDPFRIFRRECVRPRIEDRTVRERNSVADRRVLSVLERCHAEQREQVEDRAARVAGRFTNNGVHVHSFVRMTGTNVMRGAFDETPHHSTVLAATNRYALRVVRVVGLGSRTSELLTNDVRGFFVQCPGRIFRVDRSREAFAQETANALRARRSIVRPHNLGSELIGRRRVRSDSVRVVRCFLRRHTYHHLSSEFARSDERVSPHRPARTRPSRPLPFLTVVRLDLTRSRSASVTTWYPCVVKRMLRSRMRTLRDAYANATHSMRGTWYDGVWYPPHPPYVSHRGLVYQWPLDCPATSEIESTYGDERRG